MGIVLIGPPPVVLNSVRPVEVDMPGMDQEAVLEALLASPDVPLGTPPADLDRSSIAITVAKSTSELS